MIHSRSIEARVGISCLQVQHYSQSNLYFHGPQRTFHHCITQLQIRLFCNFGIKYDTPVDHDDAAMLSANQKQCSSFHFLCTHSGGNTTTCTVCFYSGQVEVGFSFQMFSCFHDVSGSGPALRRLTASQSASRRVVFCETIRVTRNHFPVLKQSGFGCSVYCCGVFPPPPLRMFTEVNERTM